MIGKLLVWQFYHDDQLKMFLTEGLFLFYFRDTQGKEYLERTSLISDSPISQKLKRGSNQRTDHKPFSRKGHERNTLEEFTETHFGVS